MSFPFVIKVKRIWFAKDADAIALFPFIFMKDPTNESLLFHEQVHIKQQIKGLLIFFYIRYIYYQFKYGYYGNPYEVEARRKTSEKF